MAEGESAEGDKSDERQDSMWEFIRRTATPLCGKAREREREHDYVTCGLGNVSEGTMGRQRGEPDQFSGPCWHASKACCLDQGAQSICCQFRDFRMGLGLFLVRDLRPRTVWTIR